MTRFFLLLPMLSVLAACSTANKVTNYVSPYRIDVRQGNLVSQDMVAQLKLGQTREQVRFILGSPLVADVFHADRWDYVYTFRKGQEPAQQRRVVVFFEDNKLIRIGGDVVADDGATAAPKPAAQIIDIPAAPVKK
jgi:outer membrane protein assembly factor BamE